MTEDAFPPSPQRLLIVSDAWYPQINGVVRSLDQTAQCLRAMGLAVQVLSPADFRTLPLPGYSEIPLAIASKSKVKAAMQALKPDSVHIATEGPLGWAARAVCLQNRWHFTTSLHTKFPEYLHARTRLPLKLSYAVLRRFHAPAAATLVTTESQRQELADWGIDKTKVWLRGVDTNNFSPDGPRSEKIDSAWPKPLWLYVGRIAVEKNLDAFLRLDLPGTKVVVGPGPAKASLEAKYKDAKFIGGLSGAALSRAYRSCDCFVFPSLTDTFGLVIVEALASGLPVAAFPVTGPKDILTNDAVGSMQDDLAAACHQALTKDSAACVQHAKAFSWQACSRRFYNELVTLQGKDMSLPRSVDD